jgi:hypothetical protein
VGATPHRIDLASYWLPITGSGIRCIFNIRRLAQPHHRRGMDPHEAIVISAWGFTEDRASH